MISANKFYCHSHGILNWLGGHIECWHTLIKAKILMDCLEIKKCGGNCLEKILAIRFNGLLEVITADRFINNGNITADTLTITTDEFLTTITESLQLGKIFCY